jgi:geranyl-CoA carboxylase beta subunit
MPPVQSRIDTASAAFNANSQAMGGRIQEFRDLENKVREISNSLKGKFEKRGQLLPRERLAALLDPGRPFLELSTLAGYMMHDDDGVENVLGGGVIAGIGFVKGVRCMVSVNDAAIKGGVVGPMGLRKMIRSQEVALENKLPAINLTESGGANLFYQSEIFIEGGRLFRNMARASAAGTPQITVVHGSSTAGGAYLPGLSDYVVVVKNRAKIFLAGPPLVKAALGQESTDEALGGAEMHASVSGSAEYLADSDVQAIDLARDIVGRLNWDHGNSAPRETDEPLYSCEELLGVVPANPKQRYDVKEIIARIVDGSDFLEFKERYGSETVCGHAVIEGYPVGIVGNNGPIDPSGSSKAAQFIQLCCQSNTPLVYLQNTTGFMVGEKAEREGAIKHGARMIQAVANATVPQVTLMIGGSFGAGNYGMCGRSFDPRFVFAWPNSQVALMGREQAAKVMTIVTEEKFKKRGAAVDAEALQLMQDKLRTQLEKESTALFATARIWDDGLIDPRDSRKVLAFALATIHEGERRTLRSNTFGVARG